MDACRAAALGLAVGVLASVGCGGLRGTPTARGGWLGYRVGGLALELPEDWRARGDASRLTAESPDGRALVKAAEVERTFRSEAECLAQAEQALAQGSAGMERVRRHPTRLGGRSAIVVEADQRGWHGWAWAACDGGGQYRLQFMGVSPMAPEIAAAQRAVEGSVRFGAGP